MEGARVFGYTGTTPALGLAFSLWENDSCRTPNPNSLTPLTLTFTSATASGYGTAWLIETSGQLYVDITDHYMKNHISAYPGDDADLSFSRLATVSLEVSVGDDTIEDTTVSLYELKTLSFS
jgi:hypothetical protein